MDIIIQNYVDKLQKLISTPPYPFDGNLRRNLPIDGGVYRIFEDSSNWKESIYIGTTRNLRERIYNNLLMGERRSHTLKRKLIKNAGFTNEKAVKQYLKRKCRVQFLELKDKCERTLFEHFAISVLKPKFND